MKITHFNLDASCYWKLFPHCPSVGCMVGRSVIISYRERRIPAPIGGELGDGNGSKTSYVSLVKIQKYGLMII